MEEFDIVEALKQRKLKKEKAILLKEASEIYDNRFPYAETKTNSHKNEYIECQRSNAEFSEEVPLRAGLSGLGAVAGGVVGLVGGQAEISEYKLKCETENADILQSNIDKAMANAQDKLDVYNIDISQIAPKDVGQYLYNLYNDCFAKYLKTVIVKDEWKDYYIDYKQGKMDNIAQTISDAYNSIYDPNIINGIHLQNTIIGASMSGITAGALLLAYPYVKNKYQMHKIEKIIERAEFYNKNHPYFGLSSVIKAYDKDEFMSKYSKKVDEKLGIKVKDKEKTA